MPPPVIKICGITNLEDAQAAVSAGASALGFNFYPRSKRYIAPEAARFIVSALGGSIWKVGVFVDSPARDIEAIASLAGLDVVQLHGSETGAGFPNLPRVWKALRIEAGFDPAVLAAYTQAEAILLDGPAGQEYGGAGIPFDWKLAASLNRRIIIAGGLDASNVGQAIRAAHAWGVDACSRLESAPGRKDHTKMIQFIQAALAADASS